MAWASAAVIASEYNGPLTQITAYGLATGESFARSSPGNIFHPTLLWAALSVGSSAATWSTSTTGTLVPNNPCSLLALSF